MDCKKQLGNNLIALSLLLALMLPTVVQFFHAFENHDHEHISCTEQKAHIHKTTDKCEICAFQITSFDYKINEYPDLFLPQIPVKAENHFTSLKLLHFILTNTRLRAPPHFS